MPFIFTNLYPKGDWKMQTFTSVLKINILCGFRQCAESEVSWKMFKVRREMERQPGLPLIQRGYS